MSKKTERFKKWLIDKVRPKTEPKKDSPSKATTRPVRRLKSIEAPEDLDIPGASLSFYQVTTNVTHVTFKNNTKAFKEVSKKVRTERLKELDKNYLMSRDPVTKRLKRIPKKHIGDISNVIYYGDDGRLIE